MLYKLRDRAAILAAETSRDLPHITVHDLTHLDALWGMASLLASPGVNLNPVEAFVLGGAFLVHDLAMTRAVYPFGLESLRSDPSWADTVAYLLSKKLGRTPNRDEISGLQKLVEEEAVAELLMKSHAQQAERLVSMGWEAPGGGEIFHLIEDPELRTTLGPAIGRIAHSHWWPIDKLRVEFAHVIGAPGFCPNQWNLDLLKIAVLVRASDAIQIDERRAPDFLRAIRQPTGVSAHHWTFQQHLLQPRIEHNRIVYTANCPFTPNEVSAWWLCFDSLTSIDKELRGIDSLLSDLGRPSLGARGVAFIDAPQRLAEVIQTDGWTPVDTRIRVTDVAKFARTLGGEQLYGQDKTVPLRELIQNASDAIRARQILEERTADWGAICIRFGLDTNGHWVEVEDNGIGMSKAVMTGPLLDFGASYWESEPMRRELPGLLARGFEPTGRCGIGFFSVFMLGSCVQITSRRYDDSQQGTNVLEFGVDPDSRPIFRRANQEEFIREGGTRVRVWLKEPPAGKRGLAFPLGGVFTGDDATFLETDPVGRRISAIHLEKLCSWLCPSLNVNLIVEDYAGHRRLAVSASDWKTLPPKQLILRIVGGGRKYADQSLWPLVEENLRPLVDGRGNIVGRACISHVEASAGVVTVGGLRSGVARGFAGIFTGYSALASRYAGVPQIDAEHLSQWASEQAGLLSKLTSDGAVRMNLARLIRHCGGDTGELPIANSNLVFVTALDIKAWTSPPDRVLVGVDPRLPDEKAAGTQITLLPGVLMVFEPSPEAFRSFCRDTTQFPDVFWPDQPQPPEFLRNRFGLNFWSLMGAVIEALSNAWRTSIVDVLRTTRLACANGVALDESKNEYISLAEPIGEVNGQMVMSRDAYVFRNPNTTEAKSTP